MMSCRVVSCLVRMTTVPLCTVVKCFLFYFILLWQCYVIFFYFIVVVLCNFFLFYCGGIVVVLCSVLLYCRSFHHFSAVLLWCVLFYCGSIVIVLHRFLLYRVVLYCIMYCCYVLYSIIPVLHCGVECCWLLFFVLSCSVSPLLSCFQNWYLSWYCLLFVAFFSVVLYQYCIALSCSLSYEWSAFLSCIILVLCCSLFQSSAERWSVLYYLSVVRSLLYSVAKSCIFVSYFCVLHCIVECSVLFFSILLKSECSLVFYKNAL